MIISTSINISYANYQTHPNTYTYKNNTEFFTFHIILLYYPGYVEVVLCYKWINNILDILFQEHCREQRLMETLKIIFTP